MQFSPSLNLRSDRLASLDAVSSVGGSDTVYVVQSGLGKRATRDQLLAGWTGSTAITTLGTIATGVWQGTAIAAAYIGSLDAAKIGSGTIATARLGSGTANSSTYLRGDQTWATIPSGGVAIGDSPTWTGTHTFSQATTYFGAAAQAATLRQVAPASGAGLDISLRASDAVSGAGGSIRLVPGARVTSGSNGTVTVQQPGGTPGSHEIQLWHDGSNANMEAKAGAIVFKATGGGIASYFMYGASVVFRLNYNAACFDQTIPLGWGNGATTPTVEIKRLANGVFGVADGAATAGGSGYDTTLRLVAKSSTTADTERFGIATSAVDNTHATRKYRTVFNAYDTAARECFRVEASGTAPMIGFYGASAVARQLLATGTGATVDDVITALQTLGLVRQS